MVRLKGKRRRILSINQLFQFHYGTIKSLPLLQKILVVGAFQFHYGTIKRVFGHAFYHLNKFGSSDISRDSC